MPWSEPVNEVATMLPLTFTLPLTFNGPVLISTVPHNVWVSAAESPNWFEPVALIVDEDTITSTVKNWIDAVCILTLPLNVFVGPVNVFEPLK